ncbi:MAG: hypothetical protein K9I97_04330 [Cryomorphaceae bacterium]|nr:hypothetical protein [Cryomorphaceae bacterium]
MANEPFITVLIKGNADQVNQIKDALISINEEGEQVTNYSTLFPIPESEELLPVITLEKAQNMFGSEADLLESRKRYWVRRNWGEYDGNCISNIQESPGIIWLEYRVRYSTPIEFYRNLSLKFPELFFYVGDYDILRTSCIGYAGSNGLLYPFQLEGIYMDEDDRPVYLKYNELFYLVNDQIVPRDKFHGYNHWHPFNFIIRHLIDDFKPGWNTTALPKEPPAAKENSNEGEDYLPF